MTIMLALRGLLVITASCCCITGVMTAPPKAIYDQRQTGELNVQIQLKNLHVVGLLDDSGLLDIYTDYDYAYDYADFTIKPGNKPTTSSTMGITEKNNITEVSESLLSQNSTIPAPPPDNKNSTERNTTLLIDEEIRDVEPSNGIVNSTSNADINDKIQSSEEDGGSGTTTISTTSKLVYSLRSQKRCKPGYVPNGDGRCRRASPWLSLLYAIETWPTSVVPTISEQSMSISRKFTRDVLYNPPQRDGSPYHIDSVYRFARRPQVRQTRYSRDRRSCGKDLVRFAHVAEEHPRGRTQHRNPRHVRNGTRVYQSTYYITKMTIVRMLFFLGMAFFALVEVSTAPAKYDQRQDGNSNIDTHLENLLFVIETPINSDKLLTNLGQLVLSLSIELHEQSRASSLSKEQESIKTGEKPYSVEIIRVNENHSDKEDSAQKAEKEKTETSYVSNQRQTSIGEAEKTESVERIPKNLKAFEFPKNREVPITIMGYFADMRKTLESKTEDGNRARNVVGNVWNPDVEPGRPGTSLKKQLLRTEKEEEKEEEEDIAPSSSNADKNDVAPSSEEKQEELRLLGDGIENCGPGRHRNNTSLMCENDESANFPL